jgi:hypothetical protein
MRYLESAAYVVLLLAALLACQSGSSSDGRRSKGSRGGASERAMSVPIKTLLSEYKDNELRSDGKWKGKLVQVTGKVDNIKKDIVGSPYVTLGTGAAFEIPVVQCMLDDASSGRASSLSKGRTVTVKGRVDGLMMNVLLRDCHIM